MLKPPSQEDALRPPMSPSLHRAPVHPTPLHAFATSPVPVMFGPNITGRFGTRSNQCQGAFYEDNQGPFNSYGSASTGVSFSASRSNVSYGASNTVQPPALRVLPCIKI